jgi:hypothetical protein
MKITKEYLKQLIKEELEGVSATPVFGKSESLEDEMLKRVRSLIGFMQQQDTYTTLTDTTYGISPKLFLALEDALINYVNKVGKED